MKKLKAPTPLTPLQRRFVLEYLLDCKAGPAYVRAGGAKRSAETHGPACLRRPHVRALVDEELNRRERDLRDKHLAVQEVTFARALVDPIDAYDAAGDPLPLHRMPAAMRRAVKSVRVVYQDKEVVRDDGVRIVERLPLVAELVLHDSRPDRELALKLAGKLRDKVELTGEDGKPISVTFNLAPPRT